MNRQSLVSKLELLQPALATNNLVPVFQCFVFDGPSVAAYNDALGIMTECDDAGEFAVNGKILLDLLRNTTVDEIGIKVEPEHVLVTAGKSKFKLPYFTKEDFLFERPKDKPDFGCSVDQELLSGIKTCLNTAAKDSTMEALMGVCINADDQCLYSCDGDAITRVEADGFEGDGSYTLPNTFCEALLKIGDGTSGQLNINKDWATAKLDNNYILFGRMMVREPFDYAGLLNKTVPEDMKYYPVPEGYADAMARARVLADPESAKTELVVSKGSLTINTTTHMGNVDDVLPFKGHSNVHAIVHAELVHRALPIAEQMSILENCTVYKGNRTLQVVSNIGE